jgi:predicted house-cleaning noncanonical NTP pyrophosphatase (MazG superfamily)
VRLIKLVRDRIDLHLEGRHGHVVYRPLPPEMVVPELRKKLAEEVAEYLIDPSVAELADVLTVVNALAAVDLRVDAGVVQQAANDKAESRGAFLEGLGMWAADRPS